MADSKEIAQFRANPVEIVIFLAVSLVFCHSLYGLFYDSQSFRPAALQPMAADPISETRAPASTAFLNLDVKCNQPMDQDTGATKVRLSGPLCGLDASTAGNLLSKTVVSNGANKFNATVFTDTNASKFSTDYIPLSSGKNVIHVEFTYRNGKSSAQDIVLSRY